MMTASLVMGTDSEHVYVCVCVCMDMSVFVRARYGERIYLVSDLISRTVQLSM